MAISITREDHTLAELRAAASGRQRRDQHHRWAYIFGTV